MHGDWTLVRMRGRGDRNRESWLLIKKDDKAADAADGDRLVRTATTSVATKRTMERIAAAADRIWQSSRGRASSSPSRAASRRVAAAARRQALHDTAAKEVTPEILSRASVAKTSSRTSADPLESVRFTHPDRVLYPETGLTKRDLAEYYLDIAGWILREVALRPLSLVRCPDGLGKACF